MTKRIRVKNVQVFPVRELERLRTSLKDAQDALAETKKLLQETCAENVQLKQELQKSEEARRGLICNLEKEREMVRELREEADKKDNRSPVLLQWIREYF